MHDRVVTIGQSVLLICLDAEISEATSQRVGHIARKLNAHPGVRAAVAGYKEVAVHLKSIADRKRVRQACESALVSTLKQMNQVSKKAASLHVVPVHYGQVPPSAGKGHRWVEVDIGRLARELGMDAQEVIERHSKPVYTVAMIGFLPGFPYLLGLDPKLRLPRRKTTQRMVPGIVAMADWQAGIYPQQSEGGWHALGYCETEAFKNLQAGDQVKFEAVK